MSDFRLQPWPGSIDITQLFELCSWLYILLGEVNMHKKKMLIMDPADNVGVLLEDAAAGDLCSFNGRDWVAAEEISFGHKLALTDIPRGTDILKYGHKIGYATKDIRKGQWVHVHNIESERGR